jgi:3-mercaptopyruvate sulfurtransferase SseA
LPGAVYGKTDKDGQTVADGEVGAGEYYATIFRALGINHEHEFFVGSRPVPLVNPGIEPIHEVLA